MKRIFVLIAIVAISTLNAQEVATDSLPYATIPEAPQTYTAGTVVSRMIGVSVPLGHRRAYRASDTLCSR